MGNSFSFNEGDFRRAVQEQVNSGMRDLAAKAQRELDAVFHAHGGQPVETVTPHLEAAMRRLDWTPSTDDIMEYAKAMAAGRRVVIKVENVRL